MDIHPVTLTGHKIRLEPLSEAHVPDLALVGLDDEIWRFMLYGEIRTQEHLRGWVLEMLERQKKGRDLPFVVIENYSQRAIGATRYLNIDLENRGLEIGGTWYGKDFRGSGVNVEAKYLLLRHAFESLRCVRVQFKTDLRNVRSQRAIERLGAVKEGILRNHMILPDGYKRHSVMYSIIDTEWPEVKTHLEEKLNS